ncbi:37S ribosomal protein S35, mitochondrial [Cytospora mali]|uniref:37S ribosomal protein S35, mitochondrial n=1 Tax=Cytospora mali TaxID=578113 RepID=A0A194V4X8_CYTMA|nr:37S ribosomal protein S35, mitochondrial [Valsa mali var. pyri (nom. inval.)]
MPPRIPTQSLQLCCAELSSSSSSIVAAAASPLERALLSSQLLSSPSSSRSFSTTNSRQRRTAPLAKQRMQEWLKKKGKDLKTHTPGQVNYLGGETGSRMRPFPSNPAFISQPVLSEEAREMIWHKVMVNWEGIKAVSAELGVDQRRVAAVVRMKEVEKDWEKNGIKLAKHYSRAVLGMVPTHSYPEDKPKQALEPINEIHVHSYTMQQLFVPTSESREFTREDAAKAFHHTLLSPDRRIPHPELVAMERRIKDGMKERDSWKMFKEEAKQSEQARDEKVAAQAELEQKKTMTVATDRFEFRIKTISADDAGKHGRARGAVGWRYGIPYEDRKKNQVKIPTKID